MYLHLLHSESINSFLFLLQPNISVRYDGVKKHSESGIGILMGTQNAELELFLFFGFLFFYVFIVLEQRVEDQDLFEKTLVGSSRCSHITQ
jgi:hypothetical protein